MRAKVVQSDYREEILKQGGSPVAKYPNASFRLGDRAAEVFARGKNSGRIAKRDLNRYYVLLRRVRPRFSVDEGGLIIEALDLLRTQEQQRLPASARRFADRDLVGEYRNSLPAVI